MMQFCFVKFCFVLLTKMELYCSFSLATCFKLICLENIFPSPNIDLPYSFNCCIVTNVPSFSHQFPEVLSNFHSSQKLLNKIFLNITLHICGSIFLVKINRETEKFLCNLDNQILHFLLNV